MLMSKAIRKYYGNIQSLDYRRVRDTPIKKSSNAFLRFAKRQKWLIDMYLYNIESNAFASECLFNEGHLKMKVNNNEKFKKRNIYSSKWLGGSLLVSAVANLDSYIASIIEICIYSRPDIQVSLKSFLRGIMYTDGLYENIKVKKYELNQLITSCNKGSWSRRMKSFEVNLDVNIHEIDNVFLEELELIRKTRNKLAHFLFEVDFYSKEGDYYGNNPEYQNIDKRTLMNWLDKLRKVAETIDEQLLHKFIGNYELMIFVIQHNLELEDSLNMYNSYLTNYLDDQPILKDRMESVYSVLFTSR